MMDSIQRTGKMIRFPASQQSVIRKSVTVKYIEKQIRQTLG